MKNETLRKKKMKKLDKANDIVDILDKSNNLDTSRSGGDDTLNTSAKKKPEMDKNKKKKLVWLKPNSKRTKNIVW